MTKKLFLKSLFIALVISLIIPFVWLFLKVPTHQVIELNDPMFDDMTRDEISEWISKNVPPPTIWEHCKYLAENDLWRGEYFKYVGLIFILVFVISITSEVIFKRKNS